MIESKKKTKSNVAITIYYLVIKIIFFFFNEKIMFIECHGVYFDDSSSSFYNCFIEKC